MSLCVLRFEIVDSESSTALLAFGESSAFGKDISAQKNVSTYEIHRHRGERAKRIIEVETYDMAEEAISSRDGDSCPKAPGTSKRNFFSGNPFIEVTEGILHLYKEDKSSPAPGLKGLLQSGSSTDRDTVDTVLPGGRSDMVCMLAVPAVLTSHDLLNFIAPCSPDIRSIRIVRDKTPNQYMVLLKFRWVGA